MIVDHNRHPSLLPVRRRGLRASVGLFFRRNFREVKRASHAAAELAVGIAHDDFHPGRAAFRLRSQARNQFDGSLCLLRALGKLQCHNLPDLEPHGIRRRNGEDHPQGVKLNHRGHGGGVIRDVFLFFPVDFRDDSINRAAQGARSIMASIFLRSSSSRICCSRAESRLASAAASSVRARSTSS